MEPLVTPTQAVSPAHRSRRKYYLAGGVAVLVLVGVSVYSLVSPAGVYKGSFGGVVDAPINPGLDGAGAGGMPAPGDQGTPGVSPVPGPNDGPAAPGLPAQGGLPTPGIGGGQPGAVDPVPDSPGAVFGAGVNPNGVAGILGNQNPVDLNDLKGAVDPNPITVNGVNAGNNNGGILNGGGAQINIDKNVVLKDGALAGANPNVFVKPGANNGATPPTDCLLGQHQVGNKCVSDLAIGGQQPAEDRGQQTHLPANDNGGAVVPGADPAPSGVGNEPVIPAVNDNAGAVADNGAQNNCPSGWILSPDGGCSNPAPVNDRVTCNENQTQNEYGDCVDKPAAPLTPKTPAGTVAAGQGVGVSIGGLGLNRGNGGAIPNNDLAGKLQVQNPLNNVALQPVDNNAGNNVDNSIPAGDGNVPQGVNNAGNNGGNNGGGGSIYNYYYSQADMSSPDYMTAIQRIRELERQLADLEAAKKDGLASAADQKDVAAKQAELSTLKTKVAKSKNPLSGAQAAAIAQAEASGNAGAQNSSGGKTASASAHVGSTTANGGKLHGAAIRGETGPEALLYPLLGVGFNAAYFALRRKKK